MGSRDIMVAEIWDGVGGSELEERAGRFVSIVGSVWGAVWRDERGEYGFPTEWGDWLESVADRGEGADDEGRL